MERKSFMCKSLLRPAVLAPAAVGVLLLLVPAVLKGYLLHVATLILMYATLASAWNWLGGFAGQASLAHAVFFGLGAYANGMLWDPRAKEKLHGFFHHWLEMKDIHNIAKDSKTYPDLNEAVLSDLRRSLTFFIDDIVWNDSGDYRRLLSADYMVLNDRLAAFYKKDPVGPDFKKVAFEGSQRAGVLTHPYLLTSFGYHGNVPGLVKYYRKDSRAVFQSLLFGTLIALAIYVLWQYVIQGNITREAFKQIVAEGGNIGSLLQQMGANSSDLIAQLLTSFSYMALASSFLGVSLGLFDFVADFFRFSDDASGRSKSALVTFMPPTLLALLFPNGFLYAIGFAGLAATIWAVIVPALMARASRKRFPSAAYRAPGGNGMVLFVIAFGLINAVAHLLALAGLLPIYR